MPQRILPIALRLAVCLLGLLSMAADPLPATRPQAPANEPSKSAAKKTPARLTAGNKGLAERPSGPYWPQWRGPDRDGVSPDTGLLKKWPKEGPPLAWKYDGMGTGFSGVSIADGRILCMGDRGGQQWLYALEIDGSRELWFSLRIGPEWEPNGHSGPRCTPTIDGERVYALGTHGDLVCAETASGAEVWRKNLPKDFGGKMHSGWGFSESPLVDGDNVICTPGAPDGMLVGLDKKTGDTRWKTGIPKLGDRGGDGAAYASVVIGQGAGMRQYVQLVGRGVVGLATDGGQFLWGYNRVANNTANIPTPLAHGDYVFCSTGYGAGAALLKLRPEGDSVQADEVYFKEGKELQNHHGGMVMIGDYIFLGHGHNAGAPTCIEWLTGKRMWRKEHGPGTGSAALTYADGALVFRFENGVVALIAADPRAYRELGKFKIPDVQKPSWPHPVITGGKLYLREQDHLFCYDIRQQ